VIIGVKVSKTGTPIILAEVKRRICKNQVYAFALETGEQKHAVAVKENSPGCHQMGFQHQTLCCLPYDCNTESVIPVVLHRMISEPTIACAFLL
jgi:hypothetical protein